MTPCGLKISFSIIFPLVFLSSAILRPGCIELMMGMRKAKVLPDPLIALMSTLNFFLEGLRASSIASSWTLVGLYLFCSLRASMMP